MNKLFKKLLNNNFGSVLVMVIAVMLSIVAVASSASLMVITGHNQLQTQYSHDKIQEELLLRSEATRLHLSLEHNSARALPGRIIEIMEPDRRTTYYISSRGQNTIINSFMGLPTEQAFAIQSLITAKRERWLIRSYRSPIKRYSERLVKNKSLAEYQYFTDVESSENADGGFAAALVKFYGADNLYGPVHSNDDIWIQQYPGWPTFHDMVTTAGRIMDFATNAPAELSAPMDQIFLGGYAEEVPPIIFDPTADLIRENGIRLGSDDTDIVYVKLSNGSFDCKFAEIEVTGVDTFGVYSWFPHTADLANYVVTNGGNWYEDSRHIWTNHVTIYDTTWTNASSFPVMDHSVWVNEAELWIEGVVNGAQTWGSADTIYIVGDITYAGTNPGDPPDDPENLNTSDYFGLVSEKKILIRYKHKDPFLENIIRDDNCTDLMIYGAYAAIGKGDEDIHGIMACHYDGIFTFQYHHPHGSTPDFEAMSPFISEEFTLRLIDTAGDGWDGAEIDLYINGEIVLEDETCYSALSTFLFTVDHGDVIETVYTAGTNEDEHLYEILDGDGTVVAEDGPNPGPGIIYQAFLELPDPSEDTTYTYVDLHKYIFPPGNPMVPQEIEGFDLHGGAPIVNSTCGFPYESNAYVNSYPNNNVSNYTYPYGTDYPWYNPVWPESSDDIVFERGELTIFGAIAQRRRGFIHRSGGDPYNHPYGTSSPSPWEMDLYHYDGSHGSTGYDKNYHYDQRFMYVQPPDYPQIYEGWGETTLTAFEKKSWFYKAPPADFIETTH
ncbi:MAG: hypothetical protein KAS53_02800 [Candidatus Cloacimonetes bacterium]|nr:hypothetical protein [Candidatus Cloacimonadota bacterium]